MLFDLTHILYMVITFSLTAVLLIILHYKVTTTTGKVNVLKISAILTVIVHYSSLWVDYFTYGSATVQNTMLLPIYPCNIMMWLLLAVSFVKKREGVAYKFLSEFTCLAGVVCGIIGIVLNENYGNNPSLLNYDIFKGLFSHTTMVFGCLYLKTAGFIKIRVSNVLSVVAGLLLFVIDGVIINTLFAVFNLDSVNSMYLLEPPFANLPFINTGVIGIAGILLIFGLTALYELITLPKEERWYTLIKNKKIKEALFN